MNDFKIRIKAPVLNKDMLVLLPGHCASDAQAFAQVTSKDIASRTADTAGSPSCFVELLQGQTVMETYQTQRGVVSITSRLFL